MLSFIKKFFTVAAAATAAPATTVEYNVINVTLYSKEYNKISSGLPAADFAGRLVSSRWFSSFDAAAAAARQSSASNKTTAPTWAVVVDGTVVAVWHDGLIVAGQGYYPTR